MWRRGDYVISTDPARLDLDTIHAYLSEEAYWSPGVPREVVERSIEHSLNFGLYLGGVQAGFARVVSDYATFAWLADVFVLPEHRGAGLGKWLVETAVSHPELRGLRRWVLATGDAHELYTRFGFRSAAGDPRFMVLEARSPKPDRARDRAEAASALSPTASAEPSSAQTGQK
jgi:GNAT superfamily N-acetyltransferase